MSISRVWVPPSDGRVSSQIIQVFSCDNGSEHVGGGHVGCLVCVRACVCKKVAEGQHRWGQKDSRVLSAVGVLQVIVVWSLA